MFDNIGGKIKSVAYVIAVLGIIGGVIGFLFGFIYGSSSYNNEEVGFSIVLGSIIGAVIAFISTYPLYALGQLVENSDKIVELLSKENNKSQNISADEQSVSNTGTTTVEAPTNPAPTMNPVVTSTTNPATQNTTINQPATAPSDLKIFTCPWCGKKYKARTSRVICPSCHKKID